MQFSLAVDPTPILPRIRTQLLARLGPQRDALRLDPVSQLVLTIISSRTRDEVSLHVFERIARRYRCRAQKPRPGDLLFSRMEWNTPRCGDNSGRDG